MRSARRSAAPRAFTLLELLIVVAVIIALAGLLFPVIGSVQEKGRKTQAASDAAQIVTAVNAYYAEYGKYPLADGKQGSDTLFSDATGYANQHNHLLFNVLRAKPGTESADGATWDFLALNPKQVIYFEGKQVKDASKPKGGFPPMTSSQPNNQNYFDPWGQEYAVFIDGDYDGKIDLYAFYTDAMFRDPSASGATKVGVSVGVASLGPDRARGKATSSSDFGGGNGVFKSSDDVITWQ